MWVPKSVADWFKISKDYVDNLVAENLVLRAQLDSLKHQVQTSSIQSDWLRMQINSLQLERTALMEKAYGIKIPTPELVRTPVMGQEASVEEFSFDDIGEKLAKQFGYPAYDTKQ